LPRRAQRQRHGQREDRKQPRHRTLFPTGTSGPATVSAAT
jgi:hypothetical protein